MSGIKIKAPQRLEKDNVSELDLYAFWNELLNYLNQHANFGLFKAKGIYSTWTAAEVDEDRITTLVEGDTATLEQRQIELNNFITLIAGCCHRNQYMMIVRQSTSLKWIWDELTVIYQHQHKGKEFLSIASIDYKPDRDTALSFYTEYRSKIMENLKPAGTILKWKANTTTTTQEVLTPTFEDHILLTVLLIIDKRLPNKVKETFGPRIQDDNYLMDLKIDILSSVPKLLEELDENDNGMNAVKYDEKDDFKVAYMAHSSRGRGKPRGKFNNYNRMRYQGFRPKTDTHNEKQY